MPWSVGVVMRTIVVADDDEAVLEYLAWTYRRAGYAVVVAHNGTELLGHLIHLGTAVRMVVSDLNMPGVSGLDALAYVRRSSHDVPFVFVTGEDPAMARAAACRLRLSGLLEKPIDCGKLLSLTRQLLGE